MWHIKKWKKKSSCLISNKTRRYHQQNPKCGDWRWTNFQMQVTLSFKPLVLTSRTDQVSIIKTEKYLQNKLTEIIFGVIFTDFYYEKNKMISV